MWQYLRCSASVRKSTGAYVSGSGIVRCRGQGFAAMVPWPRAEYPLHCMFDSCAKGVPHQVDVFVALGGASPTLQPNSGSSQCSFICKRSSPP
eukprot:15483033-Alexandrium_andersonii.AAC.1